MAAFTPVPVATRGSLDGIPNEVALVASGVYTATASAEFGVPMGAQVVEVHFDQTLGTSAQSLTIGIDYFDPGSGAWVNLITSAARTSATVDACNVSVNPNTPAVTNVSAQSPVRRRMRATVTHADTKTVTYSLSVTAA